MAYVNMDMALKVDQMPDSKVLVLPASWLVDEHNSVSVDKPEAASMKNAYLLSRLLTTVHDKELRNYTEAKNQRILGSKLNTLTTSTERSKHDARAQITSRMIPKEKAKVTEMLHEYILAHKFKSASEVRQQGGSTNKAFTLVTGQSEAIKEEYSAINMHPKEKVGQLIKYRDELRKLARDSNMISADESQMAELTRSLTGLQISRRKQDGY